MKNLGSLVSIALCLLVSSCRESDRMLTVVNADGSVTRELDGIADSAFMCGDTAAAHNPFAIVPDAGWQITWRHASPQVHTDWPLKSWSPDTTLAKQPITVKASRRFAGADDLAGSFRLKPQHAWSDLKITYRLTKRFRWFYTYYTYSETYPHITSLTRIPMQAYLSPDEARLWFNGSGALLNGKNGIEMNDCLNDIEGKYNKWFAHNVMDEEYDCLAAQYPTALNAVVDQQKYIGSKAAFIKFALNDNDLVTLEQDLALGLDKFFKVGAFSQLYQEDGNPMKRFEKEFEGRHFLNYFKGQNFDFRLLMPGKVLATNTDQVKGDTLCWRVDAYRMAYEPLVLTASSRKVNIWAFLLSGMIVTAAVGSFFVRR